ncbi:BON domain-containing protein [Puniceicoccaceae bacterium K14]|nr:BON domain-containing protein [Puniceicoccaceae bacterium K14]
MLGPQLMARSRHGIVELTGLVRGEIERRTAIETVSRISGVQGVKDGLAMSICQKDTSESGIVDMIHRGLWAKANIDPKTIRIEERAGTIFLKGVVDNPVRKALIENLVRANLGVLSLRNELVVDSSKAKISKEEEVDDASIFGLVRAALQDSLRKAHVETLAGFVVLSGVASDSKEREVAGAIAQSFRGVKWVHNEMTVR